MHQARTVGLQIKIMPHTHLFVSGYRDHRRGVIFVRNHFFNLCLIRRLISLIAGLINNQFQVDFGSEDNIGLSHTTT